MEADFQREYGIDLTEQAKTMSWRRFSILLHGLPPWGAVARAFAFKQQEESSQLQTAMFFPFSEQFADVIT